MSKTWYPVIDYEKCVECGACINKCKHGVFDEKKAPTPVVVSPVECIQGCQGCDNLCSVKAISYVGEQGIKEDDCECGCLCGDDDGGCCG